MSSNLRDVVHCLFYSPRHRLF